MSWDEFRNRVRDELGESFFTLPDETMAFIMRMWKEFAPDRFISPLRLDEVDEGLIDFTTTTQQFLWKVLDSDGDTAAVLLWLALSEWLTGWQMEQIVR